jgi:serine/threonine protein kinase
MALPAGARFGSNEVLDPVGAGRMGEVYRARDTRLDRTVAIKLLSPALSHDEDLRRRFGR